MAHWQTSRRQIALERPLVMGILNITPDSFSDGGNFVAADDALRRAEAMIGEGADIIDIGGESTRPGSKPVSAGEETRRVIPAIDAISKKLKVPISIDTTKSVVAAAAIEAGAEIVNDISGLRFDKDLARIVAESGSGLVLMHSRGEFETLHALPPVDDIWSEVVNGLWGSIETASSHAVGDDQIVVDPGIGFGKTQEQNLELLEKLAKLVTEFETYPVLVGASRKSFLGKLLGNAPVNERLGASVAAAVAAVEKGAKIVRVHDVKETVAAIKAAAYEAENQ